MEKNKPISVAFEDIRNNPDFIEHSEYRFINDDLGMVISFQAMGFRLFRTQQPYRAKEGRIVRIMQGKGRISINLIEYEATAHDIIIIPDNSLIEISEVSPDYKFQVIMPTLPIFCPYYRIPFFRKLIHETESAFHATTRNGHTSAASSLYCGIYYIVCPTAAELYST